MRPTIAQGQTRKGPGAAFVSQFFGISLDDFPTSCVGHHPWSRMLLIPRDITLAMELLYLLKVLLIVSLNALFRCSDHRWFRRNRRSLCPAVSRTRLEGRNGCPAGPESASLAVPGCCDGG